MPVTLPPQFELEQALDPISQIFRLSLDRKRQRRFERGVEAAGGVGLSALISGIGTLAGGVSTTDPITATILSSVGIPIRVPTTRRLPSRVRREIREARRAGAQRAIATEESLELGLPGFVSRRGEPVLVDPFSGLEFFVSERQDPTAAFFAFDLDLPPERRGFATEEDLLARPERFRFRRPPRLPSPQLSPVSLSLEEFQERQEFPQAIFRGLPEFEERFL